MKIIKKNATIGLVAISAFRMIASGSNIHSLLRRSLLKPLSDIL